MLSRDRKKMDKFISETRSDIIKHFYECGGNIQPANIFLLKHNGKFLTDGFETECIEEVPERFKSFSEELKRKNYCVKLLIDYRLFGNTLRVFIFDNEEQKSKLEIYEVPSRVTDNTHQRGDAGL